MHEIQQLHNREFLNRNVLQGLKENQLIWPAKGLRNGLLECSNSRDYQSMFYTTADMVLWSYKLSHANSFADLKISTTCPEYVGEWRWHVRGFAVSSK